MDMPESDSIPALSVSGRPVRFFFRCTGGDDSALASFACAVTRGLRSYMDWSCINEATLGPWGCAGPSAGLSLTPLLVECSLRGLDSGASSAFDANVFKRGLPEGRGAAKHRSINAILNVCVGPGSVTAHEGR